MRMKFMKMIISLRMKNIAQSNSGIVSTNQDWAGWSLQRRAPLWLKSSHPQDTDFNHLPHGLTVVVTMSVKQPILHFVLLFCCFHSLLLLFVDVLISADVYVQILMHKQTKDECHIEKVCLYSALL